MSEPTHRTCQEVRTRFVTLLEGKPGDPETCEIQAHIGSCASCQQIWEMFVTLRDQFRRQGRMVPPAPAWETVAQRLRQRPRSATGEWRSWVFRPLAPAAALVLLALFTGSFYLTRGFLSGRSSTLVAEDAIVDTAFGQALGLYLQGEDVSDSSRFERFLSLYDIHPVSRDWLAPRVAFRPVVPARLPGGFRLEKSYVLATRCCDGIHLRYVKGEEVIALFQQAPGHPVEYQGHGLQNVVIEGIPCRRAKIGRVELVQVDPAGRNFTLVARNGSTQLGNVVAFLEGAEDI